MERGNELDDDEFALFFVQIPSSVAVLIPGKNWSRLHGGQYDEQNAGSKVEYDRANYTQLALRKELET